MYIITIYLHYDKAYIATLSFSHYLAKLHNNSYSYLPTLLIIMHYHGLQYHCLCSDYAAMVMPCHSVDSDYVANVIIV